MNNNDMATLKELIKKELADEGKTDAIKIIEKVSKGEIKKIKIKRQMAKSLVIHNAIILYFKYFNVKIVNLLIDKKR